MSSVVCLGSDDDKEVAVDGGNRLLPLLSLRERLADQKRKREKERDPDWPLSPEGRYAVHLEISFSGCFFSQDLTNPNLRSTRLGPNKNEMRMR